MKILTDRQEALLKEERNLLGELRTALASFGADADDQETLAKSIQQLDELFLLVVVGEFNAGKSALINALLGGAVLAEGVTPTTTRIHVLRYGSERERTALAEDLDLMLVPVDLLAEISIVDTPGTNAVIREHEVLTTQFVPRADLVLFITSADRPFTESERAFLERIRDWGKKVVVVVNKIDILQSEEDLDKVLSFVTENAHALLGVTPEVFPISARAALRAKTGDPGRWVESRFEALETYIYETLDDQGRLRLKLSNPLGVGEHLSGKYLGLIAERLGTLTEDFVMLDDVDSQMAIYREDMVRDFEFRMADLEKILFEMEENGRAYFDETMRLARVIDLLNKSRIQKEFEEQIVADVPDRIERRVDELIDWLVESDLRQWQAVMDHVAERRQAHQDRIVGDGALSAFHYDRERLFEAFSREARQVIETYDKRQEAESIAEGAQAAVAAAAALEVGAVGLGTIVTVMATTVAADVTGLLLAGLVAALGFFIIPARRRRAKREMHEKVTAMREQLVSSLRGHFGREIERSVGRIREAIAPYSRFVRAEREKLEGARGSFEGLRDGLTRLKSELEGLEA